ncbi:BTAD domain-containing putative transcriptional regulator [Dactylosporangium sp. NPDC005572]|uniref:BTAD domain-containing putative transcriptional regulator n=1 Tax=Dactylosporangium sp. NPDC005572 TaxID=3156889 RepID=UPI0033ACB54E
MRRRHLRTRGPARRVVIRVAAWVAARAADAARFLLTAAAVLLPAVGTPPMLVALDRAVLDQVDVATLVNQPLSAPALALAGSAVGWALWGWLLYAIARGLADWLYGLRRRRWPRLPVPLHAAVTSAAGGLAMLANAWHTSSHAPTLAAPTQMAAVPAAAVPAVLAVPSAQLVPLRPVAVNTALATSETPAGQPLVYVVARGDRLADIAERFLADPDRYWDIAEVNPDLERADRRFPDHIEPGWRLTLPTDAHDHGVTRHATGHLTQPPPPPAPPATSAQQPDPSTDAATEADTGEDGVVAPPTVPSSCAQLASPPRAADTAPPGGAAATSRPARGITLPSGSWLDLGLAAAIAAAVALVWAHRRRRYTRRPPPPHLGLSDPDLAPMPPVVNQIRRSLRRAGQATTSAGQPRDSTLLDLLDDPHVSADDNDLPSSDRRDDNLAVDQPDHEPSPDPDDTDIDDADDNRGGREPIDPHAGQNPDRFDPPLVPRPVVPSLAHPLSAHWPPAGLGLTGPRAEDAARGFLAAALAAGGVEQPDARTHVVMPSATAATLLGAATVGLPGTPRLTVTGGLDDALHLLEAQALHRTRLVDRHGVDNVAALREADPLEEPLEPLLLIADAAVHERARVAALLAQGRRLDIHGVLLGAWPAGDTVVVADDGSITPADTPADSDHGRRDYHPAGIGRLAVLTPAEAADLIAVLAESHTGQAAPHVPTERPGSATGVLPSHTPGAADHRDDAAALAAMHVEDPPTPANGDTMPVRPAVPAVSAMPDDLERRAAEGHPGPDPVHEGEDTGLASDDSGGDDFAAAVGTRAPVRVLVLGLPEVVEMDTSKGTPRGKSVEVLVYLAVHDGQVHYESIIEDVLPDAPVSRAPHRLHTYVSALRDLLRRTGGSAEYVPRSGQRYTLNRDALDVDLWRMQQALREAEQATEPAARIAAWRAAVACYRGDLAAGADYEWIEPYRESARQQALDATLALAEALADEPVEALPIIEAALGHSPYTEALYQAAMRANAALGRPDAIRTLRGELTRRLAEIDTEPSEATLTLADHLVTRLRTPGRRRGGRVGADAAEAA